MENEKIVKLTGLPVSSEMDDILKRLANKENVSMEEINDTPEIKMARSNVAYSTPTIELQNRESIQMKILEDMLKMGSASIDENGRVEYNNIVAKGSRLDIVIGLPASGKSSAIVDTLSEEFQSRVIDNDEAKKKIPQFNNGWGAGVVHEESQVISDRVFREAVKNHENIILPKVGSSSDKLIDEYIAYAKKKGYEVNIHYVDLDRNLALGRMLNRFIEEGRFLCPDLIEKYAPMKKENRIEVAYQQLKNNDLIDGYSKWDNDVARGEKPILIESESLEGNYISNARLKGDDEYDINLRSGRESRDSRSGSNKIYNGERGGLGEIDTDGTTENREQILSSGESGRAGEQNSAGNLSDVRNKTIESFNQFLNTYMPPYNNDSVKTHFSAVAHQKAEDNDISILRGYVDSAIDVIGDEDSDYITEEVLNDANTVKGNIEALEIEYDVITTHNLVNEVKDKLFEIEDQSDAMQYMITGISENDIRAALFNDGDTKLEDALIEIAHSYDSELSLTGYKALDNFRENLKDKHFPVKKLSSQLETPEKPETTVDKFFNRHGEEMYVSVIPDIESNSVKIELYADVWEDFNLGRREDCTPEKTTEATIHFKSSEDMFAAVTDLNIFELVKTKEFQDVPNAESIKEHFKEVAKILSVDAKEFMKDQAEHKMKDSLSKKDKEYSHQLIIYDANGEKSKDIGFNDIKDIADVMAESLEGSGQKFVIQREGMTVAKGDITDDFALLVSDSLEAERKDIMLDIPKTNEELAKSLANILYGKEEDLSDMTLEDIYADVLSLIDDSQNNPEGLSELLERLDGVSGNLSDVEEKASIAVAVRLEELKNETELSKEMEIPEREVAKPIENHYETVSVILQAGLPQIEQDIEIKKLLMQQGRGEDFIAMVQTAAKDNPELAVQMADFSASFPQPDTKDNPLKSVEEAVEGNYNMIDGIINNAPPKEEKSTAFQSKVDSFIDKSHKIEVSRKEEKEETTITRHDEHSL